MDTDAFWASAAIDRVFDGAGLPEDSRSEWITGARALLASGSELRGECEALLEQRLVEWTTPVNGPGALLLAAALTQNGSCRAVRFDLPHVVCELSPSGPPDDISLLPAAFGAPR